MTRFQSRPHIITAVRVGERRVIPPQETLCRNIFVVYPGDYLCTDSRGYKFPCRAEEFENIYEPVAD